MTSVASPKSKKRLPGNLDADPLFVREPTPGADGTWGAADDDYGDLRLRIASPAIDVGDNSARLRRVESPGRTDWRGNGEIG